MSSMRLNAEEEAILGGRWGEAARRALEQQIRVGEFFGAADFVRVTSAHLSGDAEAMREAGVRYLEELAGLGARCVVPATINPRSVEFTYWSLLGQPPRYVELEHRIVRAFEQIGALPVNTCINYQTLSQPRFGEHLAWGDTGTVIWANSVAGARSNFEAGPAGIFAALTGRVPRYGYHLPEQRRGTVVVRVLDRLQGTSDWGALGCHVGRMVNDYWQVPVFVFERLESEPSADQLKHLGAALASYGSLAMFHAVGITPEARTPQEAGGGQVPEPELVVTSGTLAATYESFVPEQEAVDLVVFGTPQLSIFEFRDLARQLAGRQIHPRTRMLLTTNAAVKHLADRLGYTAAVEAAGAIVLTGVCYYIMTARELAERHGYRTILTDSAKLANIIAGYGYQPIFRPTEVCIDAAVRGAL